MPPVAVVDAEYVALVVLGERLLTLRLLPPTYPNRPRHRFGIAKSLAARNGAAVAGLEGSDGAGFGALLDVVDGGLDAGVSVEHPTAQSAFFVEIGFVSPHLPNVLPCLFCPAVGRFGEAPLAYGLAVHFADNPLRYFGNIGEFVDSSHVAVDGVYGCIYHIDPSRFYYEEVDFVYYSGGCHAIRRRDLGPLVDSALDSNGCRAHFRCCISEIVPLAYCGSCYAEGPVLFADGAPLLQTLIC